MPIEKGEQRIEMDTYGPPRFQYIWLNYHPTCVSQEVLNERQLVENEEQGSASSSNQESKDPNQPLRRKLEELRREFAARLGKHNFTIYSNDVINELIQKMPKDKKESQTGEGSALAYTNTAILGVLLVVLLLILYNLTKRNQVS